MEYKLCRLRNCLSESCARHVKKTPVYIKNQLITKCTIQFQMTNKKNKTLSQFAWCGDKWSKCCAVQSGTPGHTSVCLVDLLQYALVCSAFCNGFRHKEGCGPVPEGLSCLAALYLNVFSLTSLPFFFSISSFWRDTTGILMLVAWLMPTCQHAPIPAALVISKGMPRPLKEGGFLTTFAVHNSPTFYCSDNDLFKLTDVTLNETLFPLWSLTFY